MLLNIRLDGDFLDKQEGQKSFPGEIVKNAGRLEGSACLQNIVAKMFIT